MFSVLVLSLSAPFRCPPEQGEQKIPQQHTLGEINAPDAAYAKLVRVLTQR
jgi:hypothetical protein